MSNPYPMKAESMAFLFDDEEMATLLAALQLYKKMGLADDPTLRNDEIHELATRQGTLTSLDGIGCELLVSKLKSDGVATIKATVILGSAAVNDYVEIFNTQLSDESIEALELKGQVETFIFSSEAEYAAFQAGLMACEGNDGYMIAEISKVND